MIVVRNQLFVCSVFDSPEGFHAFSNQLGALRIFSQFIPSKLLGPGVHAANALVPEVDSPVMRMVVSLAFDQFHGIVSGHGSASGTVNGIQVGLVGLIHHVLGEWLALVQDDQTFAFGFLNGKVGRDQSGGKTRKGYEDE